MRNKILKSTSLFFKIMLTCIVGILFFSPEVVQAEESVVHAYPKLDTSEFPEYTGLEVYVGEEKLNLYESAWNANTKKDGEERCIGQFEYSGTPQVTVVSPVEIDSVTVYPTPYGITYKTEGKNCTFTMPDHTEEKSKFEVHVTGTDGITRCVDILGDPIETDRLTEGNEAEGIYYFGEGIHTPGEDGVWNIENQDNITIYIDRGAILKARVNVKNCNNVTVRGRGVLRDSRTEKEALSATFGFYNVDGLTIQDIALGRANNHQIYMTSVTNAMISNIKEDATPGNSDGITLNSGCGNITVENCFLMVNDDTIVINCDSMSETITDQILFRNIVIGNRSNGHKLSFRGYSYGVANEIRFENIYAIHTPKGYGFIKTAYKEDCGVWLKRLKHLSFENVYIENAKNSSLMNYTGTVSGEKNSLEEYGYITFKNVHLPAKPTVVAPQNAHVVMDHCYYGTDTPIASSSDLSSSSEGEIEFVTDGDVPETYTPPAETVIDQEENPEATGERIPASVSVTVAENGEKSTDVRVKHSDAGYRSPNWNRRAFLKFDLSNVDAETMGQVRLWLHSDYYIDVKNLNNPVQVYAAADNTWSADNIAYPGPDLGEMQSEAVIKEYGWVSFDVTTAVQSALAEGKTELTLGLRQKNDGSREYNEFSGVEDKNPPYLELGAEDSEPDQVVKNVIEWDFSEWGEYTSEGGDLSEEYVLGSEFDYQNLKIIFSDAADRINKGTWGIFLKNEYDSSHASYVAYSPEEDGRLTINGKAFRVREDSLDGNVVAEMTDKGESTDVSMLLEAGKTYYITSTADNSCRLIYFKYEEFGLPKAEINVPENLTGVYGQTLAEIDLSQTGWIWENADAELKTGEYTYTAYYNTAELEGSYDFSEIEGYEPDNHRVKRELVVNTEKAIPICVLPEGLTATQGQKLADIMIPDADNGSFSWKDGSQIITESGTLSFPAIFTPNDTVNYQNAEVTIMLTVEPAEVPQDPTIENVIEWNFSEWGGYTPEGVPLSDDYIYGTEFDYNNLKIIFADTGDRINMGTWGIFLKNKYSDTHPSYVSYTPQKDGRLNINGKAFRVLEDSLQGNVVAEMIESGESTDVTMLLEAGKTYYITSTANKSCRLIQVKYEEFGLPKAEINMPENLTGVYGQTLAEIDLSQTGWIWENPDTALQTGTHTYMAIYDVSALESSYDFGDVEGYEAEFHMIRRTLSVNTEKADPVFEIPQNLTATEGQKLSEIQLPEAETGLFTWMDDTQVLTQCGVQTQYAVFTPNDQANYNVIEEIAIAITVNEKVDEQIPPEGDGGPITGGDDQTSENEGDMNPEEEKPTPEEGTAPQENNQTSESGEDKVVGNNGSETQKESVKTGDMTKVILIVSIVLVSGIIIVWGGRRVYNRRRG